MNGDLVLWLNAVRVGHISLKASNALPNAEISECHSLLYCHDDDDVLQMWVVCLSE